MKRRHYDDDDGRVIAPMNVEGMPWYAEKRSAPPGSPPQLSRRENRALLGGVVRAALLVSAVFAAGYLAFILFCTNVWFR